MSLGRAGIAGAILVLATLPAAAGPTACPAHFPAWGAPEIRKPQLSAQAREICYSGYAVLHSGLSRTPLWAAERLTRDRVARARDMDRVNAFHPEATLPAAERGELSDYVRSGYDRGHMAPSGDMPDAASQEESFTLANMVPQDPDNNRRLWADIESAVRDLAGRAGEVFVVTGPAFRGATVKSLKGRVAVPTDVYKAVHVPSLGLAGAYFAPNDASGAWRAVSLDELQSLIGIDVFPGIPAASRALVPDLPQPGHRSRGRESPGTGTGGAPREGAGVGGWVVRHLKGLLR